MSDALPRHNLHVHSHFSDGLYSVEQIVAAGVEHGLSAIGITDHYHSSKLPPGAASVRRGHVQEYADAVRHAAELFAGRIRVLVGIEINGADADGELAAIEWPAGPFDMLDYVLFESIGERSEGSLGLGEFLMIRHQIDAPVGLAHTDLAGSISADGVDFLLESLANHDVFVELCTTYRHAHWLPAELVGDSLPAPRAASGSPDGLVPVPYYRASPEVYRRLAERQVLVSVGTDVHDDLAAVGDVADALGFAAESGLADQLLISHIQA